MQESENAVASVVTSNYIPQALTLYSYIKETNPNTSYLVLIIGERDQMPKQLPAGPEWIYWDELADHDTRYRLAEEYMPYELACVVRGRFHSYLGSKRSFRKWIMVDPDIGILASLDPIWKELDSACIALTPHASKPVRLDQSYPHERNFLKHGLFNAGVLGMKRSETANEASQWMSERLEAFGHSYASRKALGLPNHHDFEECDQIWLNLLLLYFRESIVILDRAGFNLGHWNLHQGNLDIKDGIAYFDGEEVVMAHFSGLPPEDSLDQVTYHISLYSNNRSVAWATLARDYLDRLEHAKMNSTTIPYSYNDIQPGRIRQQEQATTPISAVTPKSLLKNVITGLGSPEKVKVGLKLIRWKLKQTLRVF